MKIYTTKQNLIEDAKKELVNQPVVYNKIHGTITDFIASNTLIVACKFGNSEKMLSVGIATKLMDASEVVNYLTEYSIEYARLTKLEEEKERQERNEALRIAKEEEAKRKEEEKYQAKVDNALQMLNTLEYKQKPITAIEWIEQNVVSIRASIPDYMNSWFVSKFGNVPHNVVDSRKKTVSGYTMQWSPSFTIRFKTSEDMPNELKKLTEPGNDRVISNVQFIYNLCMNHDFTFGSRSEIEQFRASFAR